MSEATVTGAAPRPKVGEVMLQAGLLSPEELEQALAEQQRLGKPLGEVIVALGFASAGAVANALAEQYGAPLKTEHGFAVGLGLGQQPAAAPDAAPAADDETALRRRVEELEATAAYWAAEASRLQAEVARITAEHGVLSAETRRLAGELLSLAQRHPGVPVSPPGAA